MATISEIKKLCREYNIKPAQLAELRISNPGKFEGETLATIYFYNLVLDGCADENDCIALDESDHLFFGIDESKKYAQIYEDSNGFAYLQYLDEDEYYKQSFYVEDENESDF